MLPALDSSSLVVIAAVFLGYAALSRRLHGTSITAPMVFVGAGFVLGLEGLGWLHLTLSQESVRTLAEATLVVVLFTDASRIDLRALRREYSVPARLLGIGLPLTIVAGALAAGVVLHDVTWAEATVLAIVLAPTDAALGQAVVTDENLPSRIRQGLNVESGLNDGLCVPLLTIALAIAQTDAGDITASHAARLVVEAIGWGIVGGVIAGRRRGVGAAGGAGTRLDRGPLDPGRPGDRGRRERSASPMPAAVVASSPPSSAASCTAGSCTRTPTPRRSPRSSAGC